MLAGARRMSQTAAHLVDYVTSQQQLVTPVMQTVRCVLRISFSVDLNCWKPIQTSDCFAMVDLGGRIALMGRHRLFN